MLKSYVKSIIFICSIALCLFSCNNDDDLPDCSENFVRFKINGEQVQTGPDTGQSSGGVTRFPGCQTDVRLSSASVAFSLRAGGEIGRVHLIIENNNLLDYNTPVFTDFFLDGVDFFEMDSSYNNFVRLFEVDFDLMIVEGEFQYKVFDDAGEAVEITDGYFLCPFLAP